MQKKVGRIWEETNMNSTRFCSKTAWNIREFLVAQQDKADSNVSLFSKATVCDFSCGNTSCYRINFWKWFCFWNGKCLHIKRLDCIFIRTDFIILTHLDLYSIWKLYHAFFFSKKKIHILQLSCLLQNKYQMKVCINWSSRFQYCYCKRKRGIMLPLVGYI